MQHFFKLLNSKKIRVKKAVVMNYSIFIHVLAFIKFAFYLFKLNNILMHVTRLVA